MIKDEILKKVKRDYIGFWLKEKSFNELSDEAQHVWLGAEDGMLKFVFCDIIIDICISKKRPMASANDFAKICRVQKVVSDYVRVPSGIIYEFPQGELFEIL